MEYFNFKKIRREGTLKKVMTETDLQKLEKFANSQLASKIQKSKLENDELLFEIKEESLLETILFLNQMTIVNLNS